MPFSYALKHMLQLISVTWLPPTLVLGFLIFVLLKAPMRDRFAVWVVVYAFFGATVGSFFMAVSSDRGKSTLYVIYLESIRLFLYMTWYWVSLEFLRTRRAFVLRWLAIAVSFQFLLASYLYLGLYDLVPVPDVVAMYLSAYKLRQTLWFGDTAIYRMAGTFIESPPFGLFMFSCFVVFAVRLARLGVVDEAHEKNEEKGWAYLGATVALVGAIASLSDEVLLALIVFGLLSYLGARTTSARRNWVRRSADVAVGTVLLVVIAAYVLPRVMEKGTEAAATSQTDNYVIGQPGAERMFHMRYGLRLLLENPLAVWTGIGPGRYGDYAVRTGQFTSYVPIQVTPVAWFVEYGILGTTLILSWIWSISKRARRTYGFLAVGACAALLVSNVAQGDWLWEAWFLALAYLYCAGRDDATAQEVTFP